MISAIGIAAAGLSAAGARVEAAARNVAHAGAQAVEAQSGQPAGAGASPGGGTASSDTLIAAQQSSSLGDAAVSFKQAELTYKFQAALLGRLHDIEGEVLKTLS